MLDFGTKTPYNTCMLNQKSNKINQNKVAQRLDIATQR